MVQGEGVPYRGNAGQRLCERQTEGEESKGNAKSSPVTANRQLFPPSTDWDTEIETHFREIHHIDIK